MILILPFNGSFEDKYLGANCKKSLIASAFTFSNGIAQSAV